MDLRAIIAPVVQDRLALEEFAEALADRAPQVEKDIGSLRRQPRDRELIANLFRHLHNIKGEGALIKLDLAVAIAHPLETLLTRFRQEEFPFNELLAETILLAIDRLELATDALLENRSLDNLRLWPLVQCLERLAAAPAAELETLCAQTIEEVTGFKPVAGHHNAPKEAPAAQADVSNEQRNRDLQFFRSLALQFESRSPLFKGRTNRILRLALETNKANNNPVNPLQLEAAIYMHDVGMMLLPEPIWLKVGRMSIEEKRALYTHPGYAAGLLERIPGWQEAAEMVAQHHEMPDGRGYPNQLAGQRICDGAKILAVVDAFEAVMLKHIHRGRNRSVLRAIAEINASDKQFAPEWIAPFNAVIRRTIEN